MRVRLATPDEAERLWFVRNQAIRYGCSHSYSAEIITAWTPDRMPESYRTMVIDNPFFVVVNDTNDVISTGFLNLSQNNVDAVFTLPEYAGKGAAAILINAIKNEARKRGITKLTLESTPNAERFYQKQGFIMQQHAHYYSALTQTHLPCIKMYIEL